MARARMHGLEAGGRQLLGIMVHHVWRALVRSMCLTSVDAALQALLSPQAEAPAYLTDESQPGGSTGHQHQAVCRQCGGSGDDGSTSNAAGIGRQSLWPSASPSQRVVQAKARADTEALRCSVLGLGMHLKGSVGAPGGRCMQEECEMERAAMGRQLEELAQQLAGCQVSSRTLAARCRPQAEETWPS